MHNQIQLEISPPGYFHLLPEWGFVEGQTTEPITVALVKLFDSLPVKKGEHFPGGRVRTQHLFHLTT